MNIVKTVLSCVVSLLVSTSVFASQKLVDSQGKPIEADAAKKAISMAKKTVDFLDKLEKSGQPTDMLIAVRRNLEFGEAVNVLKDKKSDGSPLTLADIAKETKKYEEEEWVDDEDSVLGMDPYPYIGFNYLSEEKINYTHPAFILKNSPASKSFKQPVKWTVVHAVDDQATGKTVVKEQSLAYFFIQAQSDMSIAVHIPKKEVQNKINKVLSSVSDLGNIKKWYNDNKYNLLSQSYQQKEMNSVQIIVELMALSTQSDEQIKSQASLNKKEGRDNIFSILKETGYRDSQIHAGGAIHLATKNNALPDNVSIESQSKYKEHGMYMVSSNHSLLKWAIGNKLLIKTVFLEVDAGKL